MIVYHDCQYRELPLDKTTDKRKNNFNSFIEPDGCVIFAKLQCYL